MGAISGNALNLLLALCSEMAPKEAQEIICGAESRTLVGCMQPRHQQASKDLERAIFLNFYLGCFCGNLAKIPRLIIRCDDNFTLKFHLPKEHQESFLDVYIESNLVGSL